MLIAGHETTGATLAWAWHLMALHPEIGDRLAAEVHAAVGDAQPDGRDLPKLTYARSIFAEALRMYRPRLRSRARRSGPSCWAATRRRKARW